MGQAKELLQQKKEHPESFTPQEESSHDRSDLRVVEGIGPKIEQILKGAGITTWDELAVADAGQLKEILEAAGGQFRMHDPGTWPAQALLAARGKWGELKAYQDELQRGREIE